MNSILNMFPTDYVLIQYIQTELILISIKAQSICITAAVVLLLRETKVNGDLPSTLSVCSRATKNNEPGIFDKTSLQDNFVALIRLQN